ncbi:MAG: HAD-IA family hydrolase [bacterium]|nr:HAD-IA family hydrolase [bacterium]
MKKKAIIFDFDGTIANSIPIFLKAVNQLASHYNYKPIDNINPFRKYSIREFLHNILKLSRIQIPFYIFQIKKILKKDFRHAKIFDGIPETINILKAHYHLAIISGNNQQLIHQFLKKYDIDIFRPIYGSVRQHKQKEIKHFLNKYHYKKNDIVYIGDGINDITACHKAQIPIISVARGFHHPKRLASLKPDFLIDKPDKILLCLKVLEEKKK